MAASTHPTDEEPPYPTSRFRPSGRRTASFSSSSTSNSWDSSFFDEYPPFSPISSTPLNFNGVPFSWEKIPGIPKLQSAAMIDESSRNLLPLPPAGNSNSNSSAKKSHDNQEQRHHSSNRFKRDPFFAALVECSKDGGLDHDDTNYVRTGHRSGSKIARTLSDRFGCINMYTSCKRTCVISESIVCLPKSKPSYKRFNRLSQ